MTELAAATGRIADKLNSQYVMGDPPPHPGDGEYSAFARGSIANGRKRD